MPKPFVLLVTATETEFNAARKLLLNRYQSVTNSGYDAMLVELPEVFVAVRALPGMGNLESTFGITQFIAEYKPLVVVAAGICAGVDRPGSAKQNCDLIIGKDVLYYEPRKQLPEGSDWRAQSFSSSISRSLLERFQAPAVKTFRDEVPRRQPVPQVKVIIGAYGSGERVVADPKLRSEIVQIGKTKDLVIHAIEMEAAGIARACRDTQTPFVMAKAVADKGDQGKSDEWQACASTVSVAGSIDWLKGMTSDDLKRVMKRPGLDHPDPLVRARKAMAIASALLPPRGVDRAVVFDRKVDDLWTSWDVLIQAYLEKVLPVDGEPVFGEERNPPPPSGIPDTPCWVVDPIDGTQNFVRGRADVAISACRYEKGEPDVAAVGFPFRQQIVTASRAAAVSVNGLAIAEARRRPTTIEDAVIGLPGDLRRLRGTGVAQVFAAIVGRAAEIRVTGALAYDLARIALGEIDARISTHAMIWDVAAGSFLITKLGGCVTDIEGQPWRIGSTGLIAAITHKLHGELLEAVRGVPVK